MGATDRAEWTNEVRLVGRVTSLADDIELPSEMILTRFRIVVPRTKPTTKTTVDTIDLVAMKAAIQRKAHTLQIGDVVEISGEIRRRFWKAGLSVASRVEVEVHKLSKLRTDA